MPSTVISKFYYNTVTCTLRIIFVTGMVYDYKNVPREVYEEIRASFSKGIYFNQYIKGIYEFEKIEK